MESDNSLDIYKQIEQKHTWITTLLYNFTLMVLVQDCVTSLMILIYYTICNNPDIEHWLVLFNIQ